MKKSLIALAVLAASGAAMAQSAVTLYGVADAYLGSTKTNTATVVNGNQIAIGDQRQTVVNSAGLSSTRWGLRVKEDLGSGLNAFATLESGVNIDNGASQQANLLFGRQAFVGLGGNFGAVSLGRQYNAYDDVKGSFLSAQANSTSFDATAGTQISSASLAAISAYKAAGVLATPVQAAAAAAALNSSAVGSRIGAWTGYQTRIDNSIRYATPNISGFQAAVVYGFGENKNLVNGVVTPNTSATKNGSLSLTYANGPIGAAVGYSDDEPVSGFHVKNTAIGGNYDFGVAKAFLAYNRAKITNVAKQNEWSVGVKAPIGAATLVAQYAQSKGDDLGKNTSYGLEAQYSLSKRTTAYAAFNQTKIEVLNNSKNNVFGLGMRHTF